MTPLIHLGIQGSYKSFEIALFEGGNYLDSFMGDKIQASSHFILSIDQVLKKNKKNFGDIAFIAVDQGPGAFTSLRVIISTVNALAFDTPVKLIGVDGLDALASQTLDAVDAQNIFLVALLNAYNNEVYYGVHEVGEQKKLKLHMPKGYKKIDELLAQLEKLAQEKNYNFLFTGNGSVLHKDLIFEKFKDRLVEPFGLLSVCSARKIGEMGFEQWGGEVNICSELQPLYLKATLSF